MPSTQHKHRHSTRITWNTQHMQHSIQCTLSTTNIISNPAHLAELVHQAGCIQSTLHSIQCIQSILHSIQCIHQHSTKHRVTQHMHHHHHIRCTQHKAPLKRSMCFTMFTTALRNQSPFRQHPAPQLHPPPPGHKPAEQVLHEHKGSGTVTYTSSLRNSFENTAAKNAPASAAAEYSRPSSMPPLEQSAVQGSPRRRELGREMPESVGAARRRREERERLATAANTSSPAPAPASTTAVKSAALSQLRS